LVAQFTISSSEIAREFGSFAHFVGAEELNQALTRVARKFASLRPSIRTLFGDRYFFHEQCIQFTDGPFPFQLDVANPLAVRAASLISGINRVRTKLSSPALVRFRETILGGLRPDRDIRQIEHEIRCYIHFGQKGFEVSFADLDQNGRFDLLCSSQASSFEVECKTVSEETGL
jgi:hypothetical protein